MKFFIFDLDGTLLDSLADLGNACNAILEKYGYPTHPVAEYAQMVGNGFPTLVERAMPKNLSLDTERLKSLTSEAKSYYHEHMMDETMPYPGMTSALTMLSQVGAVLAVLSNKPDELAKQLVGRLLPTIPFAAVEGAMPGLPLKPAPNAVLAMMAKLQAKPADTCYIGDSNVDIFTGRNAGIMPVGAGWGFRGPKELGEAGAAIVLSEPWELGELLPL